MRLTRWINEIIWAHQIVACLLKKGWGLLFGQTARPRPLPFLTMESGCHMMILSHLLERLHAQAQKPLLSN